jgi:hypothetical protein
VAALAAGFQTLLTELRSKKGSESSVDATLAQISQMYAGASKASIDMALSQVAQQSPEGTLDLITKLKAAFVQPAPAPSNSSEQLLGLIIKMQGDSTKAMADSSTKQMELMLKLIESKRTEGGGSGFKGLQEFAAAVVSLRDVFGGNGGGSGKWFDSPFVGQALGTLDKFVTAIPFMAARRPGAGSPFQPNPHPYPMPAAGPQGLPASQPEVFQDPPTQQPQPQQADMSGAIIQLFTQIWVPMVQHLNGGARGEEFVDYVMAGWPFTLTDHAQLKAMGREALVNLIKQQPAAWNMLAPIEAQFNVFLDQFLAWHQGWDEEEDEPPPAGPPQGPVDFSKGQQ